MLAYPKLLELFRDYIVPGRAESASFLIWYLQNYLRLDSVEAIDSVCDQKGDKGVDGIFVNDSEQTITIFQSRIVQSESTTIGDKTLREFSGTLTQFSSSNSVKTLINSAGAGQVALLAKRLDLLNKVTTYDVRGEFITNAVIDVNWSSFLENNSNIYFVGRNELVS